MTYEILHNETPVAQIDTQGRCRIHSKKFMPFNLYLEETDNDLDTRLNNLSNFNFWCSSRILSPKRQYADVILKSLPIATKYYAQISLFCHCLSLTDLYWVRTLNKPITYSSINLYDNNLENPLIDASLLGKQVTLHNSKGC